MLTLKINKKDIEITEREDFVRGTVGAECRVIFGYSAWYQDFHTVTVVFKRYDGKPINILADGVEQVITIPHEIMATSGSFRVGVFGVAENIVTPTLWSDEIKIEYGTDTNGTMPEDYTPTEIEQIKVELDKNKVEIGKKQDKLTAGKNITIDDNNVISATSGGTAVAEKWEKIVDFTVAEDCTSVKIDTDLNNKPFELKKAFLKITAVPSENITSSYFTRISFDKAKFTAVSDYYHNANLLLGILPKSTDTLSIATYLVEKSSTDLGVILLESRKSWNNTNVSKSLVNSNTYNQVEIADDKPVDNNINAVVIASYTIAIGAGTNISLYGIRE